MRPSLDRYLMGLAELAATRTTCIRRGVGCVLATARGHVLSVGYNGVASGLPHCNELGYAGPAAQERTPIHACEGFLLPPGMDKCEAVHAEQNAMLQCADIFSIEAAYVTLSPCKACLKLLLNTSCRRIIFLEEHVDETPKALWLGSGKGRTWEKLKVTHASSNP